MKRIGLWMWIVSALLAVGSGFGAVELLQRHRFDVLQDKLGSLTRDMERELRLDMDDEDRHGRVLEATDPKGSLPVVSRHEGQQDWRARFTYWEAKYTFPHGDNFVRNRSFVLIIDLIQVREFMMQPPDVVIYLPEDFPSPTLRERVDALSHRHGISGRVLVRK